MSDMKKRAQVDPKFTWDTAALYENRAAWEKDAQRVEQDLVKAGEFAQALKDAPSLLNILKSQDEMSERLERVYVYAYLKQDEDTADGAGQAMMAQSQNLAARFGTVFSFLQPAILALPEQVLQSAIAQPEFANYRHQLSDLLRQKAHTLSSGEEKLLALSSEMAGGFKNAFDMLDAADLTFKPVDGKPLSHGQYSVFMENPDRAVRKQAFENYYQAFLDHGNTIAALYAGSVHKDRFYAQARGYASSMEMKLDGDNVAPSVYDSLIQAVREALPVQHRYLALRRKLLKLDQLAMYDVYVPTVPDITWPVPYDEAVQWVKAAVAPLGEEYQKAISEGFDSGWVDVYENKGKATGAYSTSAYGAHPFVLMNYADNVDSAFTLAHEMGHAMHSYYANGSQPHATADYSIFTAEVASTLNEALLLDYLLKKTEDPRRRMYLLNHQLEQFRLTVFRQVMFAEFEKAVHQRAVQNLPITREALSEIYAQLNRDYYGEDVQQDERIAHEWMRIPHFYRSFYVYQYATGMSTAVALCSQVLQEGKPAAERVLGFLKSGGSDYPIEILKRAGVDLNTPQPIRQALQVFETTLEKMEQLAQEEGLL